jgi:5-methylcytosine-specific restriction protein A
MTRRIDHRAIARQRAGLQPRQVREAPHGVGGAAPRAPTARTPTRQDRAWRRVRAERLRIEPNCRACAAKGRIVPAGEVDHVQPVSEGGPLLDLANTMSLCQPCHADKSMQDRARRTGRPVKRRSPRIKGCHPDGTPRDPGHWWNNTK